ncbi:hypothetical protein DFR70_113124 [Nocardia tenerifensis]|uniref:Antibiotic biosynthesis monooxygenase n=1 Tax=Nocardia tenerifensis TaxID=228006 RepID=A0A318JWB0_9NOCA|nr:hypothetical protein [Nocardia tenerifensis]PXX58789.1 hypothetical protein DFR70_113124 [Nocardia tenerifensis]
MAVVRTHRYTVVTGELAQLLERRNLLLRGVREAHAAFTAATLIRQEDGSYLDIWRWESAEAMRAALADGRDCPLATAAFTIEHRVTDGTVLDER